MHLGGSSSARCIHRQQHQWTDALPPLPHRASSSCIHSPQHRWAAAPTPRSHASSSASTSTNRTSTLASSSSPPPVTLDTITQEVFEDDAYEATHQAVARGAWKARLRSATGRQQHAVWRPALNPPLLLDAVHVVLVGPKKPVSCGTVARSCSSFEVPNLHLVQPRCDPVSRSSLSVSKGAQWVLHRSRLHDSLGDAVAGASLSVAMTRWLPPPVTADDDQQHEQPTVLPDVPSLLRHPVVRAMLQQPLLQGAGGAQGISTKQAPHPITLRLVFGREEFGLSDAEVHACDAACQIGVGRLQESLSLSHAVTVVLSQLYQARVSAADVDGCLGRCSRSTSPWSLALAAGASIDDDVV